jgi:hypothetical protein
VSYTINSICLLQHNHQALSPLQKTEHSTLAKHDLRKGATSKHALLAGSTVQPLLVTSAAGVQVHF